MFIRVFFQPQRLRQIVDVSAVIFERHQWQILLAVVGLTTNAATAVAGNNAGIGLNAQNLAVIVNDADPLSRQVADYYKKKRSIPSQNIIRVNFPPGQSAISRAEFQGIKSFVDRASPAHVQAYALAWTMPYRVDCMSITTAFAAGFDEAFCSKPCGSTKPNPYFNSTSRRPYVDFGVRPAMALAGKDLMEIQRLIDRGVASDGTFPKATGYLVSTSDTERNVRSASYADIIRQHWKGPVDLRIVESDFIRNRKKVIFYFTGIKQVKALDTIRFIPGAIADHLTSAGGNLVGNSDQMSSLRWLQAGATGSYGAVVEPCNYPAKFPHPGIVIDRYLRGETLIESYWKSVAWPGEGIFIGEPLAAPYSRRSR